MKELRTDLIARARLAARSAFNPKQIDLAKWIGAGPSIRARTRLSLSIAFLITLGALFIGVLRSDWIAREREMLAYYENIEQALNDVHLRADKIRESLWQMEYATESDTEIDMFSDIDSIEKEIKILSPKNYKEEDLPVLREWQWVAKDFFALILPNLKKVIGRTIIDPQQISQSRSALMVFVAQVQNLEEKTMIAVREKRTLLTKLIMNVARDQILLFLVLFIGFPFFLAFVPHWILVPLGRLKKVSQSIESGQIHELSIRGNDEVSTLARALQHSLTFREELDQKKSSKIFEIRNVLRALLGQVSDAIFIIDADGKVNYANKEAAHVINMETHHIEGKYLKECLEHETIFAAIETMSHEDNVKIEIPIEIKVRNRKPHKVHARLGSVRDRNGELSRIILVLVNA